MAENNEQSQQQYQSSPDPFAEMFGSSNQQVSQRSPPPNHQHFNRQSASRPHRQGYYAPPHVIQQQVHHPHVVQQQVHHPHVIQQHPPHVIQQQALPPYNGPPPVYGQQQGYGQRQPNSNETKTEGFPPDNPHHQHAHQLRHPYPAVDYHHPPHHNQQAVAVEYPKPPATVIEYQTQYPQHSPQQVEYHHISQQPAVVEEHGPALEIHTGNDHAYHEPPTHVEYHHPPEVEYHHPPPHKPKGFHISFNQPSPDYKIIDRHIKIPPVKFRFHINPKIVITSNTKDPLDKKHHHDDHDLEPYPPPDVFSDHNAPPSINKHVIEHYPVKHHYPIEHHAVKHHYPAEHHAVNHYAAGYPEPKHPYSVGHHAVEHHPGQEYVYDLSHGHSHLDPHRSLGHYEPTFKVKTKPIIFTEPPPTPPTTTTRATTTTVRTTTARTTARTTTTARPTRRARISARNPGFSVAFTQASTTAGTTEASTTTSTTTRRSIFRSTSERESENGGISARKDEVSTSAEIPESSKSTTTSTTTTPKSTSTTTTTTTPKPSSTSSSTSTSTQPTTTSTTTQSSTTPRTTTASTTTTTTTPATPKTTVTTTTTTSKPTTTPSLPTIRNRISPAEETTVRTTTFNVDANEIDMRRTTESPRRRPEPLLERMGLDNIESSESVKVIETTMLIEGKNQTVRFYYITQPVKLPLDVFQKMTGQGKDSTSGVNVIKIRDKRYAVLNQNSELLRNL